MRLPKDFAFPPIFYSNISLLMQLKTLHQNNKPSPLFGQQSIVPRIFFMKEKNYFHEHKYFSS